MQKYENKPRSNGVYSSFKLPKIKDGACVINLEYESIGTHQKALYMSGDNVVYFDSSRAEHIPKEIKRFIGNKNLYNKSFRT